jgi:hypothetical protein
VFLKCPANKNFRLQEIDEQELTLCFHDIANKLIAPISEKSDQQLFEFVPSKID